MRDAYAGIEILALIVKSGIHVEAHSACLRLRDRLVFPLMELAGRVKDLFSVERLIYHSELHSDTERAAKQFLFIGILQIDMCIDEKPDPFGKDDQPDAMIGFPDLQRHIRIDEEGGRRPVDPDVLQARQGEHIQVSRYTCIRRIIITQRHEILA